jgi:hypothetical protein
MTTRLQAVLEELSRKLATLVSNHLPDGVGFALLLFDHGPKDGWMTWVSNSERADMAKALAEMVARFRREELEGYSASDIDDVAIELAASAGASGVVTAHERDAWRIVAAAAVALGASPGLARTLAGERARADLS